MPSRLELLRFLRRYLLNELARVDGWIQQETLRDEGRRGAHLRATRAAERPWWLHHEDGKPVRLHASGCFFISRHDTGGACTRREALEALAQGAEACSGCRPDTDLGVE